MWIAIGLVAVVVVIVLVLAAMRPNGFKVERVEMVGAAPEVVFPLVDDFHNWGSWSPWEKLDPAMVKTYSGADRGVGAAYHWVGNSKAGEGNMEIVEASAPALVKIKLDFLKPFEAHITSQFSMVPKEGGTEVTWSMVGPTPFAMKVMHVFVSMDKMIGKDFEEGLRNLKRVAEA
jgi:hypothetical protein